MVDIESFGEQTKSLRTRGPGSSTLGVTIDRLLAEAVDALDVRLRVAEDGMLAMRFAADAVVALEASGAPFERAAEPKRVASVPLRERIG